MPNWTDVRWNSAVARQAEQALRAHARLIYEMLDRRGQIANRARAEWRGNYRDQFDTRTDQFSRHNRALADQLRQKADEIRHATARAEDEQRRREEERRHWQDEQDDDD